MSVSRVFVSYSHKDKRYLDRMMVHLSPLIRDGLDVWSDRDIKAGDKWQENIETALDEADAAILLISADFLASEFVSTNELPRLLKNAKLDKTRIFSVILNPCGFLRSTLAQFQAINDPNLPLTKLGHAGREGIWDKLASTLDERAIPSQTTGIAVPRDNTARASTQSTIAAQVISRDELYEWFRSMLASPRDALEHFWVYQYTYVDFVGLSIDPRSALANHPWGGELLQEMRHVLSRAGWDGLGTLGLFWIPPFLVTNRDGWGLWIWHVRDDDGTSWIASPQELLGDWDEVHRPKPPPSYDPDVPF